MVVFAPEELTASLWSDALPLLREHYDEIARDKDIPLDPDIDAYARIQANGGLVAFTARDAGRLVGYAVFFLARNLHYRTSYQAVQDVFFLRRTGREGLMGYRFLKFCDAGLRARGVAKVYQHVKQARDFGPLLARMGYEVADVVWAKRLD